MERGEYTVCSVCSARSAALCGACDTAYCGSLCQRMDWPAHRHVHTLVPPALRAVGTRGETHIEAGVKRGRAEQPCHNDEDPITLEPVPEDHFDVWMNGIKYCYAIPTLVLWITRNNEFPPSLLRRYAEFAMDSRKRPNKLYGGGPFTDDELFALADAFEAYMRKHWVPRTLEKYREQLWFAIREDDGERVAELAHSDRFDPNVRDEDGRGALDMAVAASRLAATEVLFFEPRINLNVRDRDGRTPLMGMLLDDQLAELVDEDEDRLYERLSSPIPAPLRGAGIGEEHDKTVAFDPNVRDADGNTVLWYAVGTQVVFEVLCRLRATDFNTQNRDGQTALMEYVRQEAERMPNVGAEPGASISVFASTRANLNLQDREGRTALIWAAITGTSERRLLRNNELTGYYYQGSVPEMLKNPAIDVNIQDVHGNTALMYAAARCHEREFFALLDDERTDTELRNAEGLTDLELAAQNPPCPAAFHETRQGRAGRELAALARTLERRLGIPFGVYGEPVNAERAAGNDPDIVRRALRTAFFEAYGENF